MREEKRARASLAPKHKSMILFSDRILVKKMINALSNDVTDTRHFC